MRKKLSTTSLDSPLSQSECRCCLLVNHYIFGVLFCRLLLNFTAGFRSVTNRLDFPVEDVSDMFVTISLDDDLLNEQQREALNPMSIKIESTTGMPSTPLSQTELRKRFIL